MTKLFPDPPPPGSPLLAARPANAVRSFLALRKSANKQFLSEPGPTADELDQLLSIAARVPDHRKMTPWRFITFQGNARQDFGKALATIAGRKPNAESRDVVEAAGLLLRAPTVVAVISAPVDDGRTPVWEQELSAGALCYNLLLAANASGWGGVWLSEWITFSEEVDVLLGLKPNERLAGFIYIGTATASPQERIRPDLSGLVSAWSPDVPD
ncbi:nitroreductase family protein [Hyphomonas neptunium ATCC 15444]|uniref:Putative NAD(P)H nitroreductase n=2 Tax=Hyphomonas TaxID=85 RepID=Q0C138_HYPNA|nr:MULTISPECIES: nitroreductase [Hyphomonas]ABI78230.1 nitroreductase family protein [Hyphomonas neptunium ATCC 15444]KCZ95030.1 nitroreductase family protein [Hyphomonas hirschiana VP5]